MSNSVSNILSHLPLSLHDNLERDGYVVIEGIDLSIIKKLKSIFYSKFHQGENIGFQSTMKNVNESNTRREIFEDIESLSTTLIDTYLPEYQIHLANFLYKSPRSTSAEVGVHRDWSYVEHKLDNAYNFWIPLDDINDSNGNFYIVPQSHKIIHGPRLTPFQDELAPLKDKIQAWGKAISLKVGQALIYHPGLIHYSFPNNSQLGRLVVGMVCKPQNAHSYHYYLDDDKKCRRYDVNKEFYFDFNPNLIPKAEYSYSYYNGILGEPEIKNWLALMEEKHGYLPDRVAKYYDSTTDDYLATYGSTIQAFRPKNEDDLHQYIIKSAQLEKHQMILDAGCGVGSPAIFFAKKINLNIIGISISPHQINLANQFAKGKWLKGKVQFQVGDYHKLSEIVPESHFDRVIFLESLGHSYRPERVIQEAFKILKPGGAIYIKDFFPYEFDDEITQSKYKKVVKNINEAYCYNVLDLNTTISQLRRSGFEVGYIKKFDFVDDIEKRAAFETRLGIDLFGDLPEFRVAEWLELYFVKP